MGSRNQKTMQVIVRQDQVKLDESQRPADQAFFNPDGTPFEFGTGEPSTNGSSPLIIIAPGDDSITQIPGPETSMNVIVGLLPSVDSSNNNKIKLPAPTGSGQRVTGIVGVNWDDYEPGWYSGESLYYEGPELIPAVRASADFNFISGLSFPLTLNNSWSITLLGVGQTTPTTVPMTFSDTFTQETFGAALLGPGPLRDAMIEHGFEFAVIPGTSPTHIGFFSIEAGEASITINNIVGNDDLTDGLSTVTIVTGSDLSFDEGNLVNYTVLHNDGGGLGSPASGSTHTSPKDLNPCLKGWVVIDIAPGVWSIEKWPDRLGLHHGNWAETYLGPLGVGDKLEHMLWYLRAFLIPEPSQRTLITADQEQQIGLINLEKDRFVLFSTSMNNANITYTLGEADGTQLDDSLPGLDYGLRSFQLDFWRHPDDDPELAVTITDDDGFTKTIAPGQTLIIRSQVTGYINAELPAGTLTGELDFPANQIFEWVAVGGTALGTWKNDIIHSNAGGTTADAEVGAGTGATTEITGSDSAGILVVHCGSDAASSGSGNLVTVTFETNFPQLPNGIHVIALTPANDTTASLRYYVNYTPTGFNISSPDTFSNSASYSWTYIVVGAPLVP